MTSNTALDNQDVENESKLKDMHVSINDAMEGTLMAASYSRFNDIMHEFKYEIYGTTNPVNNLELYGDAGDVYIAYFNKLSDKELLEYCVETINYNGNAIYKDIATIQRAITENELIKNGFIDFIREERERSVTKGVPFGSYCFDLKDIILTYTDRDGNELAHDLLNLINMIIANNKLDTNYGLGTYRTGRLVVDAIGVDNINSITYDNYEETIIQCMLGLDDDTFTSHITSGISDALTKFPEIDDAIFYDERRYPVPNPATSSSMIERCNAIKNENDLAYMLFTKEGSFELLNSLLEEFRKSD